MKIDTKILGLVGYYGTEVLTTSEYMQTMDFIQHGCTSCFLHCIGVAYLSLKIIKVLHIKANHYELTRSALLHDYFLYDWHDGRIRENKIHGFSHPKIACNNAKRDFSINKNEQKNILRHMWPLTIVPPTKREGWVIVLADKICAIYETFHRKSEMIPFTIVEKYAFRNICYNKQM